MARRLGDFDFALGRKRKYPWADWTDGSIWRVEAGDVENVESFRQSLYQRAKKDGKQVQTARVNDAIVFRFYGSDVVDG